MQAVEGDINSLSHNRSIIFIETDLLSLLPEVCSKPVALRWEGSVVACNEVARSYGVSEHLPFQTALELCPELMVLGAEHIPQLAGIVNQVNTVLRNFSCKLERISLDECFIEIKGLPQLVTSRSGPGRGMGKQACPCGCLVRLFATKQLAVQLQSTLYSSLRIRCRIGISSSKLLARLAAMQGPADACRLIAPEDAREALQFEDARHVFPGFLVSALLRRGIQTTADVRKMSLEDLRDAVGLENAVHAINAACGVDRTPVVASDMWRLFCVEYEIREKYCVLLHRLIAQVEDDGRIPLAVKVSVRRFDSVRNTCLKEAKTAPIPCGAVVPCGRAAPESTSKLMGVVMGLFRRLVDTSRPFQLSLLGLAFVRFHDPSSRMHHMSVSVHGPALRSVASCLLRKRELSVETPLNINFEGDLSQVVGGPLPREVKPEPPDFDDPTPCKKKAKLDIFIKAQNFNDEEMDLCSPSKLKVGDLSLGDEVGTNTRSFLHC